MSYARNNYYWSNNTYSHSTTSRGVINLEQSDSLVRRGTLGWGWLVGIWERSRCQPKSRTGPATWWSYHYVIILRAHPDTIRVMIFWMYALLAKFRVQWLDFNLYAYVIVYLCIDWKLNKHYSLYAIHLTKAKWKGGCLIFS